MMQNPVGWFEIYVDDMARARAFYEGVFQVTLTRLEGAADLEMWAFGHEPISYGAGGALVRMPGYDAKPGGTVVYFHCADCAVEAARVADLGGAVVKPKFSIGPFGFIALVKDSEGNMIGLHSRS